MAHTELEAEDELAREGDGERASRLEDKLHRGRNGEEEGIRLAVAEAVGERPLDGLRCKRLPPGARRYVPSDCGWKVSEAVLAVDNQGGREDEVLDEDDDLELKRGTLPSEVIIFEPPLLW